MKLNRWIAGLGAIAAIGLIGLVRADASSFAMTIVADDLSNAVRQDSNYVPPGKSGGSLGGVETSERGVPAAKSKDNNGHGNNLDGVDSSNPGEGKGGPNGGVDQSCDGSGACVDDEGKTKK
jgi:hypothetical protein